MTFANNFINPLDPSNKDDFSQPRKLDPRELRDLQRSLQASEMLRMLELMADYRILQMAREQFKPGQEVEINVPDIGWVRGKIADDGDPDEVIISDEKYGCRIHVITHDPVVYPDKFVQEGFIPSFLVRPYSTEDE